MTKRMDKFYFYCLLLNLPHEHINNILSIWLGDKHVHVWANSQFKWLNNLFNKASVAVMAFNLLIAIDNNENSR